MDSTHVVKKYCDWTQPKETHLEIGNLMAFCRYNTNYNANAHKSINYQTAGNTTKMPQSMRFAQIMRKNSPGYIMKKF
jgi:hypothetical protein